MNEKPISTSFQLPDGIKDINDLISKYQELKEKNKERKKDKVSFEEKNKYLIKENFRLLKYNEKVKNEKSEFGDSEELQFSGAKLRTDSVEEIFSTISSKANKHGKIDSNEFNGLVEIFITKGPKEFLKRLKWIFKKNNFS
ncbi:hypothetical protein ACTFIY_000010 [Dictyostelium cf. discoideum]